MLAAHCSLLDSTDFPLVFALLVPSHLCSPSRWGMECPVASPPPHAAAPQNTQEYREYHPVEALPKTLHHTQTSKSPYFQATCRLTPIATGRPYLRCPSPIYASCQLAGHGSPFAPPIIATRDNTRLLRPAQSQQSQCCWNFGRLADLEKRLGSEQGLLGTSGRSHLAPRTLPASVRPTITNEGKRSTAHKRNKRRRQPKLPNAAPSSLCRPC